MARLSGAGDQLVDIRERLARVGVLPIGARRIGLVEKLVDLIGVAFAQELRLDLVVDALLGRAELCLARNILFGIGVVGFVLVDLMLGLFRLGFFRLGVSRLGVFGVGCLGRKPRRP